MARRCPLPLPEQEELEARLAKLKARATAPYDLTPLEDKERRSLAPKVREVEQLLREQARQQSKEGPRCPRLDVDRTTTRWWGWVRFGGWGEAVPSTVDPLDEPARVWEAAQVIATAKAKATRSPENKDTDKDPKGTDKDPKDKRKRKGGAGA